MSRLNFNKIFVFSNSLLSKDYLHLAGAKYQPSCSYGFCIWTYVAFSLLKDAQERRVSDATVEANLKILEIVDLQGVAPREVWIIKRVARALRNHAKT